MSASDDKRRLERARERVQKAAARRRVESKAKRNKKQREAEKRRRRIEARDPEGVREKAAVAKEETKDLASAAGELAKTAPGGKTLKSLAKKGAAAVGGAAAQAGLSVGDGGGTLRERLAQRSSSKPVQLESGYEEVDGEMLGYYQPGEEGQKFYYVPGNEPSRRQAKRAAKDRLPADGGGGGRPSIRELAGQAAVSEEFLSLGTRAEYDPAPPVRETTDHLQPSAGVGGGFGPIDFAWGTRDPDAADAETDGGMSFDWDDGASDDADWGMGFDWDDGGDEGVGFEW
jgi:hypothetical protein